MPGRSQKEMYDMRKPREIYKPILLVKRKNGMYQQQNFKEIEAAKGKSDGDKKSNKHPWVKARLDWDKPLR